MSGSKNINNATSGTEHIKECSAVNRKQEQWFHHMVDCKYVYLFHDKRNNVARQKVIMPRPTPWKPFLKAVFGLQKTYKFVFLPLQSYQNFIDESEPVRIIMNGNPRCSIQINGDAYPLEVWTLWEVCKFCIESFEHGFFQRFWKWTWKPPKNLKRAD